MSDHEREPGEAADFGDGPGNTVGRGADDVGGIGDAPGAVPEGERDVEAAGRGDGGSVGRHERLDPAAVPAGTGEAGLGGGAGDLGGGGDLGADLGRLGGGERDREDEPA